MDIRLQVKQYIRQEGLLAEGDHVIVGLSGGADSVCLLYCLLSLREVLGITVSAVHVHHGIRGEEADRDANFCSRLCMHEKIPFRLLHADVPEEARKRNRSLEEAGREIRYLRFRELRRDYEIMHPGTRCRIAVAHHMDDQAETVLMNLCRGTGLRGLAAMPSERDGIIRPLLSCRRRNIEEWLKARGYEWIEDGTNSSDDYTRNRIRHHLLPEICEINSRGVEHLAFIARQAGEWDAWLVSETEKWMSGRKDLTVLPVEELAALPEALCGRIVLECLAKAVGSRRNIGSRHIRAVQSLLTSQVGSKIRLPGGLTAERGYQEIFFRREDTLSGKRETLPVRADFSVFPLRKGQKIPEKEYTKWFDYDKISKSVGFRTRKQGDELVLAGVGTKTVQRYMIDARIPAEERDRIPILAAGDSVLWIVGYRMNAAYQVTEDTRTVLQVTVHPSQTESDEE